MAGYIGSKSSVTVVSPETDSRYVNVAGDTMTGDLTVEGAFTSVGIDDNASSTAMTIDSSGNVLVGTTAYTGTASSGSGGGGFYKDSGGTPGTIVFSARSGDTTAIFNRLSTDGDVVTFRKSGATVGSIANAGANLAIGSAGVGLLFGGSFATPAIGPRNMTTGADRDNAIDLGWASNRFDDVYATNGTIQTSDRNEKQDIDVLSEAETRVAQACKGLLRKFRWKDAVAEKGDDARIHFGIIAQDLQDAFAAEGLDAGRYAMFISSTWTDEETGEERTRLGVRYPELLAFIIGAL